MKKLIKREMKITLMFRVDVFMARIIFKYKNFIVKHKSNKEIAKIKLIKDKKKSKNRKRER